jgi:septum formation protein
MTSEGLPLVLASGSPRRRELLQRLGLRLRTSPAELEEAPGPGESPPAYAMRLARAKATAVARKCSDPILAADTVVVLGSKILGKPEDRHAADAMLRGLAARSHVVLTATAVQWGSRQAHDLCCARVHFRPLSEEILAWYLATGEWTDKAGGYAVQGKGALLVERVEGNVQGVVGLPLSRLPALLAKVGLRLRHLDGRLVLSPRAESPHPVR